MFGLLKKRKLRAAAERWIATLPLWKVTYRSTPSGDHKGFLVHAKNRVEAIEVAFHRGGVPYSALVSVKQHKGPPGKWEVL